MIYINRKINEKLIELIFYNNYYLLLKIKN